MKSLALASTECGIIIFGVAVYSYLCCCIQYSCLVSQFVLNEVGLESPPDPINCLLSLEGMGGADVITDI